MMKRKRFCIAAAVLFLAGAPAWAQERVLAFLPVGDLLRPSYDNEPYLTPLRLHGSRRLLGEEALSPQFEAGDEQARRVPPWFTGPDLVALLANQTQLSTDGLVLVRGGALLGCARAESDKVRAALDAIRQRLPANVVVELELVRVRGGATEVLLARRVDCPAGRTKVASATVQSTALVDFEVEIAQAAAAANPVVHNLQHGAMVVLRPHVMPTGEAAIVEVLARVVEPLPSQPIDLGHPGFGNLDRARQGISESARVVRTNSGGKSQQRWSGPDGTEYRLTMQLLWQVPAPARPGAQEMEYIAVGGALGGFVGIDSSVEITEEEQKRIVGADTIDALVRAAGVDATEPSEGHVRLAVDRAARPLAQAMGAMLDAMAQAPAIEVEFYDAPVGARLPTDGPLPIGMRRIGATTLECVDESGVVLQVYDEESVVRDWDIEVAQGSRIPDPKCQRAAAGLFVNLRRNRERLELDGEYSVRQPTKTLSVALSAPSVAFDPESRAKTEGAQPMRMAPIVLPADIVNIDVPTLHRLPFSLRTTVKAGAPTVVRQSAAPVLGPDRELLIVVRSHE